MGSTRSNIKEKIGTKWSNDRFWWTIKPTFGQIISGNKCDRNKLIIFQKEGVNKIVLGIKRDPMGSENATKGGQSWGKFPTTFKYGSAPLRLEIKILIMKI